MLEIIKAKIHNLNDVRVFCDKCNYDGGVKQKDRVFLANINNELAGVVRLCPEMNVLVLRGMQVLPEFQGQGIGTKLLKSCNDYLGQQPCYCIPWSHLHSFYGQIGFQIISPAELPDFSAQRLKRYIARNMNVIPMYKSGKLISH
ncbi:MAG: GNAT family N-acetyltransferase [Pleurocapsa sp.]